MFGYYFDLAIRSFRRNVALTILMVLAIAFGVGASMTTLTVLHVLSSDPIPGHSKDLYYVQLDPYELDGYKPGEEPAHQMTRADSELLLRDREGDRQAMMTGGAAVIEPERTDLEPFFADGRWTSADFFAMFRVPFVAGDAWTAADDEAHARVAVLSRELAEKLFGSTDVVGKAVRVNGADLRVVGVMDRWRPVPHFYDLNTGEYSPGEQLFVPFSTSRDLKLERGGNMDCWGESEDPTTVGAPCIWIQYWVELDSAAKAAAYKDYLVTFSEEAKAAGRFQRPPNVRLRNVNQWLDYNKVVPDDVRLQTWLALGFLLVCLINTVGLLLTKFMRRSAEIGVRRALGASKRSIFLQLLVEAGTIGLAGGVLGLGFAYLGLWAVKHQPTQYAGVAKLDLSMLLLTFVLAVVTSILAGLLPAWRGSRVTPAIQLKSH
jgi:putative ABC transport system permease protein